MGLSSIVPDYPLEWLLYMYLEWAGKNERRIASRIRKMVEMESPSDDPKAINQFVDWIAAEVNGMAKVKVVKAGQTYGNHLLIEFALPGKKKSGQITALGHSDTVWPMGTLKSMPFREADGRLWGPGVLDMKAGLAFFLGAMDALRELDVPVAHKVVLQINSEEEIGSPSSRSLTEQSARLSKAVLVLEPGTGLTGKLKTARKGVGDYTVRAIGKASHAGVDFSAGANAIVELSRQVEKIAGFTDLKRGLTVSPGVMQGGTRSNVVPAEATLEVDIRIARLRDEVGLTKKFQALKPFDKRCRIEVSGGLNRPPMERSPGIAQLYRLAQKLAAEMGIPMEESMTGGGSDGNFTAALGVPTLDGLGAVGEGAHATNESLLVNRIADRTALLAALVEKLGGHF